MLALSLAACAQAQLELGGEIGITSGPNAQVRGDTLTLGVGLRLFAHLEATIDLAPVTLRAVLDPSVALPGPTPSEPHADLGLSEAYALYRRGNLDLSAGLERLPLSGARLSEPLSLEPRSDQGRPQGLLGVRASVFLERVRLRPALLYRHQDDQLGGAFSVRVELSGAEFEAHGLYLSGAALGLSGSGLVGELVLYGEGWLIADADLDLGTLRARGALGLSGFLGDALWTIEATYAPAPQLGGGLGEAAFPQLGAQLSLPLGESGALDINLAAGLPASLLAPGDTAVAAVGSLSYSVNEFDYRVSVGPTVTLTELGSTFGVAVTVVGFF